MKSKVLVMGLGLFVTCCAGPDAEEAAHSEQSHLEVPCTLDDPPSGPGSSPMGLAEQGANEVYAVWPNGRIPYVIDPSLDAASKGSVLQAMSNWQTKTQSRVRFEPAKPSDSPRLIVAAGAVPITNHVGYRAGSNSRVTLAKSSSMPLALHELGHVLGLNHEQRRADRDKYILVKLENIADKPGCANQFKICKNCVPVHEYNIDSVMQYDSNDLSLCHPNGPVLLRKDGSKISHVWKLTPGDVSAIYELYGPPLGGTGAGGAASGGGAAGASGVAGSVGGAAGGAAGSGGAAGGNAPGSAGGHGVEVRDLPDEEVGNGATAEENASCGVGRRTPDRDAGWPALALVALGLSLTQRAKGARRDLGELGRQ